MLFQLKNSLSALTSTSFTHPWQLLADLFNEFSCLFSANRLACTQLPKHIFPGLLYKRYYGSVSLLATVPGIVPHPGSLLITKHRLYCRVNVYIYLLVFDPTLLLHPLPQNAHHH